MAYPSILSYSSVSSGGNLVVPNTTKVIVGMFYGNPEATLAGVSPIHSTNYSTTTSLKVWDGKSMGPGSKALAGGVTGHFYCLADADLNYLDIHSEYNSSALILEDLIASEESIVIGIGKSSSSAGSIGLSENGVAAFTYSYNNTNFKVGYRNSPDDSLFSFRCSDGASGATTTASVIVIPYKRWPSEGVAVSSMSEFMML